MENKVPALVWRVYFEPYKLIKQQKLKCLMLFKFQEEVNAFKMICIEFIQEMYFLITAESIYYTTNINPNFFDNFDTPVKVTRSVAFLNQQTKEFYKFKIKTGQQYDLVIEFGKKHKGIFYDFFCNSFSIEDIFMLQNKLNLGQPYNLSKILCECVKTRTRSTFPITTPDCVLLSELNKTGFFNCSESIDFYEYDFGKSDFLDLFKSCTFYAEPTSSFSSLPMISCVFDIETRKPDLTDGLPTSDCGVLICISALFYKTSKEYTADTFCQTVVVNLILLSSTNVIKQRVGKNIMNKLRHLKTCKIINIFYSTEYELILDFVRCINASVSFICGYNSAGYDLPFVIDSLVRYMSLAPEYRSILDNFNVGGNKQKIESSDDISDDSDMDFDPENEEIVPDDEMEPMTAASLATSKRPQASFVVNQVASNSRKFSARLLSGIFIFTNQSYVIYRPFMIKSNLLTSFQKEYQWNSLPFSQSVDSCEKTGVSLNECVRINMSFSIHFVPDVGGDVVKIVKNEFASITTSSNLKMFARDIFIIGCFVKIDLMGMSGVEDSDSYEVYKFETSEAGEHFLYLKNCCLTTTSTTPPQTRFPTSAKFILYPIKHELSTQKSENLYNFTHLPSEEIFTSIIVYCVYDVVLTRIIGSLCNNKIALLSICGNFLPMAMGSYLGRTSGYIASMYLMSCGYTDNLTYTDGNSLVSSMYLNCITNDNFKHVINDLDIIKLKCTSSLDFITEDPCPILDEYLLSTQPISMKNNLNNFFTLHQNTIEHNVELLNVIKNQNDIVALNRVLTCEETTANYLQKIQNLDSVSWKRHFKDRQDLLCFSDRHVSFKKMYLVEITTLCLTTKNYEHLTCFGIFFICFGGADEMAEIRQFIGFLKTIKVIKFDIVFGAGVYKFISSVYHCNDTIVLEENDKFIVTMAKRVKNLKYLAQYNQLCLTEEGQCVGVEKNLF